MCCGRECSALSLTDPGTGRDYKFPFDFCFGKDSTQVGSRD
jgi:hypothetical protein